MTCTVAPLSDQRAWSAASGNRPVAEPNLRCVTGVTVVGNTLETANLPMLSRFHFRTEPQTQVDG